MIKKQIFAHRGLWAENSSVPNSPHSIESAFNGGYAVETDIRDQNLEIVISHDPCNEGNQPKVSQFLNSENRIALNVKSDGLSPLLSKHKEILRESGSFVFDCSIPQALRFREEKIPLALRLSEYERELPWKPDYVWLDAFHDDWWIDDDSILSIFENIPTIIVSPELHGRENRRVWDKFISMNNTFRELAICTDYPIALGKLLND